MGSSIRNVTAGIPPIVDNLNSGDADKTLSANQGRVINQRLIEVFNQPDMVVMTQAELANYSDDPKFVYYDQTTKDFKQKGGTIRNLITGDWIIIKSIETLTANLEFPNTYNRAKIETDRHFQIPLGDQGGGIPFAIIFNGSDGILSFETDKDFRHLSNLTEEQQRGIKNRGNNNKIDWNNIQIFSGFPQQFFSPVEIKNPYIIPENGNWYNGLPDPGVNDGENCFRDLWLMWGGIESLEMAPIFNPLDSLPNTWKQVFTDMVGGRFIRPVALGGGTVDPDVHTREHPAHLGVATSISTYVSSGTNEISGISDADIKKVRLGARIYDAGAGIPEYNSSPDPKTTIITNIVHNGTDDNSIFLIDSETRLDVAVTASGNLTVDLGGNTGVSVQEDQNKSHSHSLTFYIDTGGMLLPAKITRGNTYEGQETSSSGGDEARSINANRYSYWKM